MPNINDRIGSQNVIRVLSNASAPPTRLVNLTDVNSAFKDKGWCNFSLGCFHRNILHDGYC